MRAQRLLPIAVALSACTTLQTVDSPVTYLERNNPEAVRIYTQQGELAVLRAPRLNGTSVSGFNVVEGEDATFNISGIQRMEVKQVDRGRTALFIGAMSVLGGAGIYMIGKAGGGKDLICDSYDNENRCVPRQSRVLLTIPIR
jgi:hypothetical protein